ncbi:MAG: hypothetical protein AAGE80_11765 [Pseudomonadota bacterium]
MPSFQERANNLFLAVLFLLLAAWQLNLHPAGMHSEHSYSTFHIARNLIESGRSTFDGIDVTNGYHLLWMAVLSGLTFPLAQTIPVETALMGVAVLPLLFFAWMVPPIVFVQILAAVYLTGFGAEGVFAALLFIALTWAVDTRQRLVVIALTAAIVLTRVDFLICFAILAIWARLRDRPLFVPFLIGSGLGLVLYFAANWLIAGEFVSVALLQKGVLQQAGSVSGFQERIIANIASLDNQIRFAAWIGAIIALGLAYVRPGVDRRRMLFNPVLHLALFAFIVVHVVLSELGDWYFAAPLILAIYAAGRALPEIDWRAAPAIVFCLAIPVAAAGVQFFQAWEPAREYARVLDSTKTVDGTVFAYEGAAYLAWRRYPSQVIDGKGVMNTATYARNADDPQWLTTYLADKGVTQFAGTPELGVCPKPGLCCGVGTLDPGADYAHGDPTRIDRIYVFKNGRPCPLRQTE